MSELQYGDWFGSYATQAAAKRYLTMQWTGPKVSDHEWWAGETREHEGRWQVRLATPTTREGI